MYGQRILEMRTKRGYTQDSLGAVLNVSPKTIGTWEREDRKPPIDKLTQMAKLFDVTTDYLLGVNKTPEWATEQQVTDLKTWLDDPAAMDGFSFGGAELTEDEKDKLKMSMTQIFWNRLNLKRMPINKDEGGDNK